MHTTPEKAGALAGLVPFLFLDDVKRKQIETELLFRSFEPGEIVIQRGKGGKSSSCATIFIVIAGGFVAHDKDGTVLSDAVMTSGCYFGERAAIFGTAPSAEVRAISNHKQKSTAWSLEGDVLLDVLAGHDSRRFALALASDLRHKQGLFDNFLSFKAAALSGLHHSHALDLPNIMERFSMLNSALHPLGNDARQIDYDGWSYALRRLPHNITSVYSIVCSRRPLSVLAIQNGDAQQARTTGENSGEDNEYIITDLSPGRPIGTDERRRTCWEVMPGKLFILLRELISDYLDVLTCFCVHAIESNKLRKKLQPLGTIIPVLMDAVKRMQKDGVEDEESYEIEKEFLSQLVLRQVLENRDCEGLKRLWPAGTVLHRLLEISIHHGDYSFYLDSTSNAYSATAEERWCKRIISWATKLVGSFENSFESDLVVDIVSSNTHSVLNCISPYIHSNREKIVAWGRENAPDLFGPSMANETDRLYPLAKMYFDANPDEEARAKEMQSEVGIVEVHEQGLTGISVQLIDINKLKSSAYGFDDSLRDEANTTKVGNGRHLLINIDYAFGSQGENILRLLLLSFGKCVRSINVVGKAGGLTPSCKRGDILFPTHILDENQNGEIRPVDNIDMNAQELVESSGRQVHVGPVITVLGTILQSRELLLFYERFFHSTGMEMEASWYLRAIHEAKHLGSLPPTCRTRLLYYVSDTPLQTESSLASKMTILEGVPPLYSITRVILGKALCPVLSDDSLVLNGEKDETRKTGKEHWDLLKNAVRAGAMPVRTVRRESLSPKK